MTGPVCNQGYELVCPRTQMGPGNGESGGGPAAVILTPVI